MNRFGGRLCAVTAIVAMSGTLVAFGGAAHAVTNVPNPQLTFSKLIPSRPWPAGTLTSINANDIEGLVSVPINNSIWVADDNRDRIYEIDATTGGLKSQILKSTFQSSATQVGTGQLCSDPAQVDPTLVLTDPVTHLPVADTSAYECLSRTDDFESLVYDPGTGSGTDALYVTSGACCAAGLPTGYPGNPTVWKLRRDMAGHFAPSQWQALPQTAAPTTAGWRPGTGMYFGKSGSVQTYDFASNALGSTNPAPSNLVGIDFTDASTVFLTTSTAHPHVQGLTTATSDSTIGRYTFDGSAFTPVAGWTFPLTNTGMIDARDLTIVNDTFYVTDGYDYRTGSEVNGTSVAGDHPIYVYTLGQASAPVAAFTTTPSSGFAPLNVQFTDTSTNNPTSWTWDFDNNGVVDSTVQNPTYVYSAPGTYTAKLTSTNATGGTSITHAVTVTGSGPAGPAWHYEARNGSGSGVTNDRFGGGNTLLQYGSQLHGFYRDTTTSSLDHSWWDGAKWNYEKLDTSAGSVGNNVASIVYNGQLQLFYTDSTGTHLTHRWWDGARWNSEAFDATKLAGSGAIALKLYGMQLQLFYANDSDHLLRHAWWDGARWNYENLDTGTALPSSNTSVDASKYGATLQVVYKTSSSSGDALRHSWYDGARWNAETLDGTGSTTAGHTGNIVGDYAQLQSFGGQLDVLYRDASANGLRHAWWNGAKWSFELLDGNLGVIPGHTSNSVGTYIQPMQYAGGLHVWYRDLTSGALRHAWYSGGWHVEVLDGTGATNPGASNSSNTGLFPAVVDYGGQIQLTYLDAGNSDRLAHTWYS